jgi:hypothetical protein
MPERRALYAATLACQTPATCSLVCDSYVNEFNGLDYLAPYTGHWCSLS